MREKKWHITVPGTVFSRSAEKKRAKWMVVVDTPAEITTTSIEVYELVVNGDTVDSELAGLARLRHFTNLQSLNLFGCEQVTDVGVKNLKALTSLLSLDLGNMGAGFTDKGLAHLKRLTNLQLLNLRESEYLTDVGVAALRKALPKCKIMR